MNLLRRQIALLVAISTLGLAVSAQFAIAKKDKRAATAQMDEKARALHALNRLAFGPRTGDVERVAAMGVDKWIDQQLHPDKIDDHALDARLEQFRTLRMNTREIVENFPPPAVIKAIAEGKQSMPSDSARRAVYEAGYDYACAVETPMADLGFMALPRIYVGQRDGAVRLTAKRVLYRGYIAVKGRCP